MKESIMPSMVNSSIIVALLKKCSSNSKKFCLFLISINFKVSLINSYNTEVVSFELIVFGIALTKICSKFYYKSYPLLVEDIQIRVPSIQIEILEILIVLMTKTNLEDLGQKLTLRP